MAAMDKLNISLTQKIQNIYRICTESVITIVEGHIGEKNIKSKLTSALLLLKQKQCSKLYTNIADVGGGQRCIWPAPTNYAASTVSTSGRTIVFLYDGDAGGASSKTASELDEPNNSRIQLMDRDGVSINLTMEVPPKLHKQFWGGQGSCQLSASCSKLLYVAEAASAENPLKSVEGADELFLQNPQKYLFVDKWGEDYMKKSTGRLFIADLNKQKITAIPPLEEQHSYQQPQWLKEGTSFLCTALHCNPFRLGLYACNNRPSSVYFVRPNSPSIEDLNISEASSPSFNWLKISGDDDYSAWSPIIAEEDDTTLKILYLSLQKNTLNVLPHFGECQLNLVTMKRREDAWGVVDRRTIKYEKPCSTFNGLYCYSLKNWVNDEYLFVNTIIGVTSMAVKIRYQNGPTSVCRIVLTNASKYIPEYSEMGCTVLLDYKEGIVLLRYSTPSSLPLVILGREVDVRGDEFVVTIDEVIPLGSSEASKEMSWSIYNKMSSILESKEWSVVENRHVLLRNKDVNDGEKRGLVASLHGGPHSCATTDFSGDAVYLTELGFDVLHVNYRGSVGFGQTELLTLLGNVGTQDVMDVYTAVNTFIQSNKHKYDGNKIVVIGGSHGGFLTCHLIGQYPEMFCAASTRNPVTNLAAMAATSDIPDWCFAEGLGRSLFGNPNYGEEEVAALFAASPMRYVSNTKTPLLLGVGGADLRVPPSQSLHYYKTLKSLNKEVKMLYYPENNHQIPNAYCSENYWVNTGLWFTKYIAE